MTAARATVSLALLLGAAAVVRLQAHPPATALRRPLEALPDRLGGWTLRDSELLDERTLNLLRVRDYLLRRYDGPGGLSAWLYVAYWERQRSGENVHSPKNCLPANGWVPVRSERLDIAVPGAERPLRVNRYLVENQGQRQVVLYWYHSGGEVHASEVGARLAMVKNALLHHRTDGALIRVSAAVDRRSDETTARLARFVAEVYPRLAASLPPPAGGRPEAPEDL